MPAGPGGAMQRRSRRSRRLQRQRLHIEQRLLGRNGGVVDRKPLQRPIGPFFPLIPIGESSGENRSVVGHAIPIFAALAQTTAAFRQHYAISRGAQGPVFGPLVARNAKVRHHL